MLTIIEINARADGGHALQSQSGRRECWLDGYIAVPAHLEAAVWACCGYCDLDIQDGTLVGITAKEVPVVPEPDPEPTADERVSALEEALAQTDETAITLYEAQAEQETINASQDEVLLEIYEMLGG